MFAWKTGHAVTVCLHETKICPSPTSYHCFIRPDLQPGHFRFFPTRLWRGKPATDKWRFKGRGLWQMLWHFCVAIYLDPALFTALLSVQAYTEWQVFIVFHRVCYVKTCVSLYGQIVPPGLYNRTDFTVMVLCLLVMTRETWMESTSQSINQSINRSMNNGYLSEDESPSWYFPGFVKSEHGITLNWKFTVKLKGIDRCIFLRSGSRVIRPPKNPTGSCLVSGLWRPITWIPDGKTIYPHMVCFRVRFRVQND